MTGRSGGDRFSLGSGVYSSSDATQIIRERIDREFAKAIRIDARLIHRWSHGRHELEKDYAPIIRGAEKIGEDSVFTFVELVELMTIATFRAANVKPRAIRDAYERGIKKYGAHPFAREGYRTDGVGIFTSIDEPDAEELSKRQTFFEDVLRPILLDVSYINGTAATFDPMGPTRAVVIDARKAFGAPTDRFSGVKTYTLYGMHESGESDEVIADWYNVSIESVRDAVAYEESLRKAA